MMGILETPYGTRDFLPREAAFKRAVEQKIFELFSSFGYEEVVTPTMEYLEILTTSRAREPQLFKMFDQNNRTLALRHEMTTPIARLAVSRLKDAHLPLKLSYLTSVFRFHINQNNRQCEFYQAGVELIGISNAFADAEIIALAAKALNVSGLQDFKICLGQVDFVRGLLDKLSRELQSQIKAALEHHDIVTLNQLDIDDSIKKLPTLQGSFDILIEAKNFVDNEKSQRALENLIEIYHLLEMYGLADKITFDLSLIRDFEYYTGMVFEAYSHGVGYSLAGGGRYDNMLRDFGADRPATGFALGIERILAARKFQGCHNDIPKKNFYVSYSKGNEYAAIRKANELRANNEIVELSLSPQTRVEAEVSCTEKFCKELIYLS